MTKVKTSKLAGITLDWAVAKAEGMEIDGPSVIICKVYRDDEGLEWVVQWEPTTNWSQGGPLIDREIGNLWKNNKLDPNEPDVWTAAAYRKAPDGTMLYYEDGPTPLVAAMRCYVASRLGDEVDVPEELL